MYVLNLTVPPRQVDNRLEPAKAAVHLQVRRSVRGVPRDDGCAQNWEAASAFVASVIDAFLMRHGFLHPPRPRACQERGTTDRPAAKKRKSVRSSRIGCDAPAVASSSRGAAVPTAEHADIHAPPLEVDPTVCYRLLIGN